MRVEERHCARSLRERGDAVEQPSLPAPLASAARARATALRASGSAPVDLERERGAEHERVAMRGRVAARERCAQPRGVRGGIAAAQVVERAALDAGVARVAQRALDAARAHVVADERAGRRRLVPARLAVHDERARHRHAGQRVGHARGHRVAEGADDVDTAAPRDSRAAPRMLNTVRTPSAWRTGAMCFIAG